MKLIKGSEYSGERGCDCESSMILSVAILSDEVSEGRYKVFVKW